MEINNNSNSSNFFVEYYHQAGCYALVGIPSPLDLRRLTLSSVSLIRHWWFVLIVGLKQSLKKSLKFSWKMGILRTLSQVILDPQDLNLIPVKYLVLLNVWYIWSSHGLDLPVRYSLTKFSHWLCIVFTVKIRTLFTTRSAFLFSQKNVQPILQQNMVVYKFQCHCNADCIGRSIQRSKVHVWQHMPWGICGWSQSLTSRLSQLHKSAIHKHLCDYYLC